MVLLRVHITPSFEYASQSDVNSSIPRLCILCGALRDLVPFVQFEKYEKHPWRSVLFRCRLNPATLLKVTLLHGCFSRFLT